MWSLYIIIMQTMHRLMEMLSGANVDYSETNFDDKRDLEELVHPYVCNFLNQKLSEFFIIFVNL